MTTVLQTRFSDAFSWVKNSYSNTICNGYHFYLFFNTYIIVSHYWLRQWLGAEQTTSHYLNQCWPRSKTPYSVTRPRLIDNLPSNLQYKSHQISKLKCFSSHPAVVFAQSVEATRYVDHSDVVGAAPTGDAPITSEWSTISLPTKVRLILEIWRYLWFITKNIEIE